VSIAVGLVDKTGVWIGADSIGCSDEAMEIRRDPKAWQQGPFVFAFSGSFRMAQLVRYATMFPKRTRAQDVYSYMVLGVAETIRGSLKGHSFEPKERGNEGDDTVESGGPILVGYEGRLFRIDPDFHVAETANGFDAIGAAGSAALGALHQQTLTDQENRRCKRPELDSRNRVLDALTVATKVCHQTTRPFTLVRLEKHR
jgi:hypothetical protein